MIMSMTGFGAAVRETAALRAKAAVRSLNSRYLEINVNAPRELGEIEADIRRLAQERVRRGRVDVMLRAEVVDAPVRLGVSRPLIAELVREMRELGSQHGLATEARMSEIFQMPGVVEIRLEAEKTWSSARDELIDVVLEAFEGLMEMRRKEGERLMRDILGRLEGIELSIDVLRALADSSGSSRREQLAARAAALRDDLGLDESRLLQEIARLVDRCDVNEEIVRIKCHVAHAREACAANESSGRRIDFLAQEMMREANTAGSKSLSAEMVRTVIDIKSDIERLREQVQNVE
ncbi:MAG: YicC family protein [Vicinamibacteria bacterium]|nr:YicC family protein [Vicinamibacteria bacterium]